MIYSNLPLNEFAERYKIQLDPVICFECKGLINFTKPFLIKNYKGVEAEDCSTCKKPSGIVRLVPVNSDKLEFWYSILS